MTKLSEVIEELGQLLDRQRVWDELNNYLNRFLDTEVSDREVMKKDDGTPVDEEIIQGVIDEITSEKLNSIEERIDEIRDLEVKHGEGEKEPETEGGEEGQDEGGDQNGEEDSGKKRGAKSRDSKLPRAKTSSFRIGNKPKSKTAS